MTTLAPHAARVVRAACACVDRRPSVPEAMREIIVAVEEYRRITNYESEGEEQCLTERSEFTEKASVTSSA